MEVSTKRAIFVDKTAKMPGASTRRKCPFYGQPGTIGYKKNELRHSREAPHTNHIINNTKTNNRVQRYGDFPDLQ